MRQRSSDGPELDGGYGLRLGGGYGPRLGGFAGFAAVGEAVPQGFTPDFGGRFVFFVVVETGDV